ncbi:hypothetical protein [Breoghania sp.]|uniref:hypothetical protein n=1 Tax=Breoghania sp. TaxID=2065378 RepID=UPI002639249F|nr:hypothetical protein [Breoghania sp.]MDJ0930198.1 hypothetical protein [Breoghania sp.]
MPKPIGVEGFGVGEIGGGAGLDYSAGGKTGVLRTVGDTPKPISCFDLECSGGSSRWIVSPLR